MSSSLFRAPIVPLPTHVRRRSLCPLGNDVRRWCFRIVRLIIHHHNGRQVDGMTVANGAPKHLEGNGTVMTCEARAMLQNATSRDDGQQAGVERGQTRGDGILLELGTRLAIR